MTRGSWGDGTLTREHFDPLPRPDTPTSERFAGLPSSVPEIRTRCRERAVALGADPDTVDAIALAVSEAASNAVVHAYAGRPAGEIELRLVPHGRELEVVIADQGSGLGHARSDGGLGQGLLLMDQLADTFRVTSTPGAGTTVTMRFRLS